MNFFEGKKRQDFLAKIKMQVDKRYGEIIPSQIREFRNEYRKSIEYIVSSLENQISSKLSGLEKQVKTLIEEKKKEDLNVQREISILNSYKGELELTKAKLNEVL